MSNFTKKFDIDDNEKELEKIDVTCILHYEYIFYLSDLLKIIFSLKENVIIYLIQLYNNIFISIICADNDLINQHEKNIGKTAYYNYFLTYKLVSLIMNSLLVFKFKKLDKNDFTSKCRVNNDIIDKEIKELPNLIKSKIILVEDKNIAFENLKFMIELNTIINCIGNINTGNINVLGRKLNYIFSKDSKDIQFEAFMINCIEKIFLFKDSVDRNIKNDFNKDIENKDIENKDNKN